MAGKTIYFTPRLTEHDILLERQQEYELFLRSRLTEAEIVIRSIPYREALSVENRTVVRQIVEYLCYQKEIAVSSGAAVSAEIDSLLSVIGERFPGEAVARSQVEVGKRGLERIAHSTAARHDVNALYLAHMSVSLSAGAGSAIYGFDIRRAIGDAALSARAENSAEVTGVRKYESVGSGAGVSTEISAETKKPSAMESRVSAGSSLTISAVRLRRLDEVDGRTLDQMDSMTLEELDFVEIF